MTTLRSVFRELAEQAPAVTVPPNLLETARRRRTRRRLAALAAVIALVALALAVPLARSQPPASRDPGGGLPQHLVTVPRDTDTVERSPVGPAAAIYSLGEDNPQSDPEDFDFAWWRGGHTVASSTIVARDRDAYRIVRSGYYTGAELSPDGRYLIAEGRVVDLATGRERLRLAAAPTEAHLSPDGQTPPGDNTTLYGRWTEDGTRLIAAENDRTMIVSWPSGQVERLVRHPGQRPVDQDLALSPDGRDLAVQSNGLFRVYGADGDLRWSQTASNDLRRIGGRAAWRADGRLFVFDRQVTGCSGCGWAPGTWRLRALDGATGEAVAAPAYPEIRDAMFVNVVTWRGDVAYAVVAYTNGRTDDRMDIGGAALVRLAPGAPAPQVVLAGPEGTHELGVATDLVDRVRPVGRPEFGRNPAEDWGPALSWAACPALVAAVVSVAWVTRRRWVAP
ncbi:hypothetical protein Dvina_32135 [Dactylosporangium vinaceum]|uniref:WD40 repeat domain-containing protein n=1 Tax=Dactylosporangium vinaceum TaxID=53362 RepID=A0ABV5MAQ0_9ACTN|nr:hypothetical protein [Dactylosporangium vinaceum]UAB92946.1 hypothetical protein Dvina_32135 [Dactylosporangium vinaceum]